MNRRMAGLAAALMLMTFAPIHTHAALRRVPEGMKTEQGEWTTKSKKDKEKDEESWQQEMLDSVNAARKKAGVAPLELDKRRSAKQHSSAQTSASNPMTTPVQTEKNPRQRWMMQASATPGGEKISTKNRRPYSPPCSPGWSQRVTRRIS